MNLSNYDYSGYRGPTILCGGPCHGTVIAIDSGCSFAPLKKRDQSVGTWDETRYFPQLICCGLVQLLGEDRNNSAAGVVSVRAAFSQFGVDPSLPPIEVPLSVLIVRWVSGALADGIYRALGGSLQQATEQELQFVDACRLRAQEGLRDTIKSAVWLQVRSGIAVTGEDSSPH